MQVILDSNMDKTDGPQPRIFVVEDDPGYQRLLELSIRRLGCRCECCYDGKAALIYAASHPCDMMFIDIHIPELDGFMVACQLREMGYTLPLIAISALKLEGIERKAMAVGFNGFLQKPVEQEQIKLLLDKYVFNKSQGG
jgi:two-component system capsular synthesis sensor histidine kinase RcsC